MTNRLRNERGAALLTTLLATMLLTGLGIALVLTTSTETLITANYRTAQEALYAADAAMERSIQDLLQVSTLDDVLSGGTKSSFVDGGAAYLPDGATADLVQLTANLQTESDATYGADPNRPVWRVYAHSPMSSLLPDGAVTTRSYAVVWVADDPSETDGNPLADVNGLVLVRAEAFGEGGTRKAVEATVMKGAQFEGESGYTGQRGMDERNQRRRSQSIPAGSGGPTRMTLDQDGGMTIQ